MMSSTRADDKLLGFKYQFYYFLLELLKMKKEDIVGFEVQDDVHIENNNSLSLIQLKHTRQTTVSGMPINLTTSDIDLWKTLSNWIDVIQVQINKKEFIKNTKFIFITNKSESTSHIFLTSLNNLVTTNSLIKFKSTIKNYKDSLDSENKNKVYINKLLGIDDDLLELFLLKLEFIFDLDNIIEDIKDKIKYGKSIKPSRINNVFSELTGILWEAFFNTVKNKNDFQLTGEEFYLKTVAIFSKAQSERLPFIRDIERENDESVFDYMFAKQLDDIGFEKDKIFEANYYKTAIETNLNEFIQSGEITNDDKNLLDENTIASWKEEFDDKYLDDLEKTPLGAKQLYLSVIKKDLDLAGQRIEWKEAIKGQFIKMSNIPKIGWLHNWKEVYNEE
jgi:hypothetical protein